jgi:hypothetical protein
MSPIDVNILDRPRSIIWRIFHGIHYLLGGLTFAAGSCMYFAKVIEKDWALNTGAALFIVGSFFFLLADLQEWWYYRIGCVFDWKYREPYEVDHAEVFQHPRNTRIGRFKRAEIGLNCFASIIGSALYLAGSILFLPDLSYVLIAGEALFISGSAVIYLSQGWKVYRLACTNEIDRSDRQFRLNNLLNDMQAVVIDISAGLGGFFYFIGTILFLPQFTTTDFGLNRAAGLFLCGGFFFTIAGVVLQYRYYCSRQK